MGSQRPTKGASKQGFTLPEIVLGQMFLLVLAVAIAPPFVQELVVGEVLWERRLATRLIESELDAVCHVVHVVQGPPSGFDGLASAERDLPQLAGGRLERTVQCLTSAFHVLDCPLPLDPNLKLVKVRVTWTSRMRPMSQASPGYVIARSGMCGRGT